MAIYTDQLNRKVEVKEFPKRIVSLVPSQTELLFDLGVGKNVVGITKYCIHPYSEVKKITKIGGTKDFDIDKITQLNPDLIIANKEENYKEGIEALAQKFPVWISDVNDLDSAYKMITEVGKMVGAENKIRELLYPLSREFTNFRESNAFAQTYSTLYFIWKEPFMVAGKDTFISQILEQSIFKNTIEQNRYPILEKEEIQQLNPQVVLLSSEPYPFREKHIQEFATLLPNAYIRVVDGELFSWYGSRIKYTVSYLKQLQTAVKLYFKEIKIN